MAAARSALTAASKEPAAIETETTEVEEGMGDVPLGENTAVELELDTVSTGASGADRDDDGAELDAATEATQRRAPQPPPRSVIHRRSWWQEWSRNRTPTRL